MNTKVTIYFDARKVIQRGADKGRCHIKIMVTFYDPEGKRSRRYYKTDVFATRQEFNKIITGQFGRGGNAELEAKRTAVLAFEKKAKDEAKPFVQPDDFEARYNTVGSNENPLDMLLAYADELRRDGQVGTANFYKNAHSSFSKYSGGKLTFYQVTPKWLLAYEKWFMNQVDEDGQVIERSISTVGTHVRNMRTIFNRAIALKKIPADIYPFARTVHERDKYKCPTSTGRKRALNEAQKNIVLEYTGPDQKDVDMWIFSYFCNGMNFTDMAQLKYKSVHDGVLTFFRTKTRLTDRNRRTIQIVLREEVKRIIAKWGNRSLNPNDYIFPVLRDGLTPTQAKYIIMDWIKVTNKGLKKAAKQMKLPEITTYWARHTFATIAYRNGVSIEEISEALGHTDIRTTKNYLDSFDLESKKEMSNVL